MWFWSLFVGSANVTRWKNGPDKKVQSTTHVKNSGAGPALPLSEEGMLIRPVRPGPFELARKKLSQSYAYADVFKVGRLSSIGHYIRLKIKAWPKMKWVGLGRAFAYSIRLESKFDITLKEKVQLAFAQSSLTATTGLQRSQPDSMMGFKRLYWDIQAQPVGPCQATKAHLAPLATAHKPKPRNVDVKIKHGSKGSK